MVDNSAGDDEGTIRATERDPDRVGHRVHVAQLLGGASPKRLPPAKITQEDAVRKRGREARRWQFGPDLVLREPGPDDYHRDLFPEAFALGLLHEHRIAWWYPQDHDRLVVLTRTGQVLLVTMSANEFTRGWRPDVLMIRSDDA